MGQFKKFRNKLVVWLQGWCYVGKEHNVSAVESLPLQLPLDLAAEFVLYGYARKAGCA